MVLAVALLSPCLMVKGFLMSWTQIPHPIKRKYENKLFRVRETPKEVRNSQSKKEKCQNRVVKMFAYT